MIKNEYINIKYIQYLLNPPDPILGPVSLAAPL